MKITKFLESDNIRTFGAKALNETAYSMEDHMDDWQQICKSYCRKIGAELLFVNETSFGYETKDGQMVHMYVDELMNALGKNESVSTAKHSNRDNAPLKYDKNDKSWDGIFNKANPQETANLMGRKVDDGERIYEPIKETVSNEPEVIFQKGNKKIIKDGYGYAIDDGINANRFYVNDKGEPKFDNGCSSKFWLNKVKSLIKNGKITSRKSANLKEASGRCFVTVYEETSTSGPEEGGYTSYGWEATHSKSFRDENSARKYLNDFADGAEVIYNTGDRMEIKDEWGDTYLIVLETPSKRGSHNQPARSWAASESGDKADRAYFDRQGRRVAENPRVVAQREKNKKALMDEVKSLLDSVNSIDELLQIYRDIVMDDKFNTVRTDAEKLVLSKASSLSNNVNEAFNIGSNDIQNVKVYNQYNYTIQELRINNRDKTFERGNFSMGKPDKKTKNRQEYEDIVDKLKEMGYTEIPSDYRSLRNKTRKGVSTDECLTEDVDIPTLSGPQEGAESGLTSLLTSAIQDEWKTIQMYNDLSLTARLEGFEDIAKVIDEINTEESVHVGQLQSVLKTISPNAEAIELGVAEGEEQVSNPIATM